MSRTIDERVVSMQFDNRNFEQNVANTMSSLGKLKQSLNLTGATKGLQEVDYAAKKVDMTSLGSAVDTLQTKFSALSVVGVTALANITNSAVNAGKKIASALTIDPVKTGFSEYETQINAVQTILANTQHKGTTLEQVNTALDELNRYADKTIYNFTEMTRNIGTFTAAGIDLETSVNAIQGIANLAAVSGSTSQQASTAMYQLSQALAAGTIRLMDWNSVVNAGMGGEVFQNALKETSKALGTGAEAAIEAQGSFRESLSTGWLTAEVLTETLKKFTSTGAVEYVSEYTGLSSQMVQAALDSAEAQYGEADAIKHASKALAEKSGKSAKEIEESLNMAKSAEDAATKVKTFSQLIDTTKEAVQSGWTQTWETIVGDFEEAKEMWSGVSEVLGGIINASAEARNSLLSGAFDSGWDQLLGKGIADEEGYKESIKSVAKEHGVNLEKMIEDTGSFEAALKKGLGEGTITSDMLTKSVSGLADKMNKMSQEEREAAGYTHEHVDAINKLNAGLKDGSVSMDEFVKKMMRPSGRELMIESVKNAFDGLVSVIRPIKKAFNEIFPPATSDQLYNILEGLKEFTSKLKLSDTASENLKRTFKGLFAVLDIARQAISAVFSAIKPLFGGIDNLGGGILGVTANIGDFLVAVNNAIKRTGVFKTVATGLSAVFKFVAGIIGGLLDTLKTMFGYFSEAISGVGAEASAELDELASSVEGSTVAQAFKKLWEIIKTVVAGVIGAIKAIGSGIAKMLGNASLSGFIDIVNKLIAGGIGVAIIDFIRNLKEGVGGFGDIIENAAEMLDVLRGCLEAYQTNLRASALLKIAGAIAILVASVLVLSFIDSDKLYDAIVTITALFAGLMYAFSIAAKGKGSVFKITTMGTMLLKIAASVLILAIALDTIAGLGIEKTMVGLLGIAGLAGILVGTAKLLNLCGDSVIKGATRMIIFAAAIKVLATVVKDLADLSWGSLGKGLLGVMTLAGVMVATAKIINIGDSSVIKGALNMVIFAAAIKIMASVCKDFADMSSSDMTRGLTAVGVMLAEILVFTKILNKTKIKTSAGVAMIAIAAAMKIFASAVSDMSTMSWEEVARGLTGMAVALAAVVIALKLMPKNMAGSAVGLVVVSAAILILAEALGKMGGMSWEGVAKGLVSLGGSLAILAAGLHLMNGTLSGSAALLIAAAALSIFAPTLVVLSGMSWGDIAKGLIVLAGAFAVLGIAGAVLGPLVPAILGLSGALALIGLSVALTGAGLVAAGAGLAAIAVGLAAVIGVLAGGVEIIIEGIVAIIKGVTIGLINGIKDFIVAFGDIFTEGAPSLAKGLIALVKMLCDVLVECVPAIVNTVLELLVSVLDGLAKFAPKIVEALTNFIVGILGSLGRNIPRIIVAIMEFIGQIFTGVIDAIKGLDFSTVMEILAGVGLVTALMFALAALVPLVPLAMTGVLGLGVLITELALVLAAIGALAQIPGLEWLITEGGDFLGKVGTAIGQFIGGIAGGVAKGFTSSLPDIGNDLSAFMRNLRPFIEGAREIDDSIVSGVKSLVSVVLSITGANIIESIASFVTGKSSIDTFAEELPVLGNGLRAFSDSIDGISPENITAAANAAKVLAEMTHVIPNEGGMVSWFTGENSIAKFGDELPSLGEGLKGFSDSVSGISPENIVAAANAAKALAEMTAVIPNEGGVKAWFTGENSISKFAEEIVELGEGLVGFGTSVAGVTPATIIAGAQAAKALAEMTQVIPNEGGVKAWFTGENSITKFAKDIVKLGEGLLGFSVSVTGIVPTNVLAGANAAKALAEMTAIIPNEGGVKAWFTGDNSITNFAHQLPILGQGLLGFSVATMGIVPENIISAANAAKTLAEMTAVIPNEGGVKAWFTGESSIASFAHQLPVLGQGLNSFSVSVMGIVPENIMAAADAAKSLAEMTAIIPNEGGIKAWFTGESSISSFASQLPILGLGLQAFSTSVAGINIESVNSAANAAKTLAGITQVIPNEGGVKAWFTGETSIANFATQLPILGQGLADFSTAVNGINPDNVTSAANAAKALAEMTAVIPKEGGIKAWFTGETSIANFADKLPTLGKGLTGFGESVANINTENITTAANAAKSLGEMTSTIPKNTDRIAEFGTNLVSFGKKLSSFFTNTKSITADAVATTKKALDSVDDISSINSSGVKSAATAITDMAKSLKELSKVPKDCTSKFQKALKELGETSVDSLVKALKEAKDDTTKAGEDAMKGFIEGIKSMSSKVETACEDIAADGAAAANNKVSSFESAGKAMAEGLANGISTNSYMAKAKAKAMAEAAVEAARKALAINSPSKVFRSLGYSVPEGFAMGIDKLGSLVKDSSVSMADTAIGAVSKSIARIASIVNSDMDTQPTIRPVLDLSDIKSGAGAIGDILDTNSSVGILANVGSISAMMNRRGQNGNNSDVVSAINSLRKDLGKVGNTTNIIDGVTYDDGSNINDAVQKIVRAARIEGRV